MIAANSTSLIYLPIMEVSRLVSLTPRAFRPLMSQRSHLDTPSARSSSTTVPTRTSAGFRPIKCVGNWQLTRLLGRGTFTEVYFAKPLGCRPDWPADYAVKLLSEKHSADPIAVAGLEREAEVSSQVSQPHLVPILEAHVSAAPYYLVMPKLEGASVGRIIQQVGHLSVRQALWIARQVAEALEALHVRQWLHGDVKPANVVVSPGGHATLIDFGLALHKHEAMLTAERTARGTLNYLAPEVMTSAYCSDQRSDIYSLGISLFEMLTGRLPFVGNNAADLIELHRRQPLPDARRFMTDLGRDVVMLLKRMTAKQPIRRQQSARELIDELMPLEVAMIRKSHA